MSLFTIDHLDRSFLGRSRTFLLFFFHRTYVLMCWSGYSVKDYLDHKMNTGSDTQGELAMMIVEEFRFSLHEDDTYQDIFNLDLSSGVGLMLKEVLDKTFALGLTHEEPEDAED